MSVSNWRPTNQTYFVDFRTSYRLGDLTMKKLTIRYIRYALALLANIGFKLYAN
jgi:hypothetical protein